MKINKSELYTPICWPEVQNLMEHPDFTKYCFLINDLNGYEQFGDSAYMCNVEWLESIE